MGGFRRKFLEGEAVGPSLGLDPIFHIRYMRVTRPTYNNFPKFKLLVYNTIINAILVQSCIYYQLCYGPHALLPSSLNVEKGRHVGLITHWVW